MRKIVVFTLMICMGIMLLTGCNSTEAEGTGTENVSAETNDNSTENDTNAEGDSEQREENVEEILADMTVEEKIAYMMPAKLELGEDEVYTPEPVTADMIMATMEEITVTDVEYAEIINEGNLAALLVLNAPCMDVTEFNQLVTENFGTVDDLMNGYSYYRDFLYDLNGTYGQGESVLPEELVYDPYLKNQAEQISCMIKMYQADSKNSKEFYDIFMNYLYYDTNEYMTFQHHDSRLEGTFLPALGLVLKSSLSSDIKVYNPEFYTSSNVLVEQLDELREEIQALVSQN